MGISGGTRNTDRKIATHNLTIVTRNTRDFENIGVNPSTLGKQLKPYSSKRISVRATAALACPCWASAAGCILNKAG